MNNLEIVENETGVKECGGISVGDKVKIIYKGQCFSLGHQGHYVVADFKKGMGQSGVKVLCVPIRCKHCGAKGAGFVLDSFLNKIYRDDKLPAHIKDDLGWLDFAWLCKVYD